MNQKKSKQIRRFVKQDTGLEKGPELDYHVQSFKDEYKKTPKNKRNGLMK